jgi:hypothetical protein
MRQNKTIWPIFEREKEFDWINQQHNTAKIIRYFWDISTKKEKRGSSFLYLITSLGWINWTNNDFMESTRIWRNSNIAEYIGIRYDPEYDDDLYKDLMLHWKHGDRNKLRRLLQMKTGITHYYRAFRGLIQDKIKRHQAQIAEIFSSVADNSKDPIENVKRVGQMIDELPKLKTPTNGETSFWNALSPALACLDKNRKFPIMNARTGALLGAMNWNFDSIGEHMLAKFIGQNKNGVRDNFDLDVYSQVYENKFPKIHKIRNQARKLNLHEMGFKHESDSYAFLTRKRMIIRKRHMHLINRFRDAMIPIRVEEDRCDAFIKGWNRNRNLLIEAKTASDGPGGRNQIRLAIGQLFDYRRELENNGFKNIDIAILLPTKPSEDVKGLLSSLGIEVLWMSKRNIEGSVALNFK